jgi:LmbE family N-acetylglucosaminyl deacetylase
MHIYLSPHLDDAVLSCGGAIHHLLAAGHRVQVITIFAGDAGECDELSPFALEQHGYWGNPPRPLALRRAEDRAALALLGATAQHLDCQDAVYRTAPGGQWIYIDLGTLFGTLHPLDPVDPAALAGQLASLINSDRQAVLYAPLGVGQHIDHQIVHLAARQLLQQGYRLAFYEDYPYAEKPTSTESAVAATGAGNWRLEAIPLDTADLVAKVSALGYYRSQMSILFGSAEQMPNRVWAFAASRSPGMGLAERIWWPQ